MQVLQVTERSFGFDIGRMAQVPVPPVGNQEIAAAVNLVEPPAEAAEVPAEVIYKF